MIRVLHDNSLRDDPTRMIRAARYEQRLGFEIHPQTAALIGRDLSALDRVSGTRVRQEIDRTLHEYNRGKILLRMDGLGVLAAIHPGLAFGLRQAAAMECLGRSAYDSVLALWAIIGWATADEQIEPLCGRLAPSGRLRHVLCSLPGARAAAGEIGRDPAASDVAARLRPMPAPTVRALACAAKSLAVRDRVLDYLRRTRNLRPRLSGDDLIALGLAEGPEVGAVLSRLRDARIDGTAGGREDEMAIVKRAMNERRVPLGT
jgi:tRNA nucleotidyltransferase (CCA-adding enzyme)